MTNDAYLEAIDDLAEAARAHRSIYAADEQGLLTWHAACETTWARVEAALVKVRGHNGKERGAEPSDFIQIGRSCRSVRHITAVDYLQGGAVAVACESDPPGEGLVFRGAKAAAFLAWWEREASVNVLWTEPDDESPA